MANIRLGVKEVLIMIETSRSKLRDLKKDFLKVVGVY